MPGSLAGKIFFRLQPGVLWNHRGLACEARGTQGQRVKRLPPSCPVSPPGKSRGQSPESVTDQASKLPSSPRSPCDQPRPEQQKLNMVLSTEVQADDSIFLLLLVKLHSLQLEDMLAEALSLRQFVCPLLKLHQCLVKELGLMTNHVCSISS